MTPQPQGSRLLIAVEREELFQRFDIHLAGERRTGQNFQARHCLPDQVDGSLRESEVDALIVIEPRFHEALPEAVRQWKLTRPDLQVLFIFRRLPQTPALVDLMRSGAFDVLDTEIEAIGAPLIQQILNDLQRRLDEIRVGGLERDQAHDALAGIGLIGESVEMQNLFVQVLQAARLSSAVVISGEPGSGKRLVAHAIHSLGARSGAQIVTVDCLSLSPSLLSSALLGVPANNGTGGGPLFEAAVHGTLLLNEVSEMPAAIQEQLQKVLEAGDEVRLISTASKRLDQLVDAGLFRADLCVRLNAMPIDIPPLRRRLLDVPLLSRYFLSRFEREGRGVTLSEEAAAAINRYHWPGNVRELKAALASAAALAVDDTILLSHLPEAIANSERGAAEEQRFTSNELNLARLERQAILRALQMAGFDKTRAARMLGIGKTTLYRKLKEMSAKK